MKPKLLILLLLLALPAQAQFRFSPHGWDTEAGFITRWDKVDHFIATPVVYVSLRTIFKLSKLEAFVATALLAIAWEIKDGFLSHKIYGFWGGDGFCWKDLTAGMAGMVTLCSIDLFGG